MRTLCGSEALNKLDRRQAPLIGQDIAIIALHWAQLKSLGLSAWWWMLEKDVSDMSGSSIRR